MAAVLCNGIGQLCQSLCNLLAVPCKACAGCCGAIGKGCGFVFCQTPFTPYIVTTIVLQVFPIIWGIMTVLDPSECNFLNLWMYIFALLSACHVIGAFYIAYRMAQNIDETNNSGAPANENTSFHARQQSTQPRGRFIWDYVQDLFGPNEQNQQADRTESSSSRQGSSNSWKRLGHLACYDYGVALYMIVFIAWMVWLPLGISTNLSVDDENEDCDRVSDHSQGAIICGFVYGVLVALTFCCSLIFLKV